MIEQQEPSRLGSVDTHYRGDVEIIVAKALDKDKTRRYASAGDMASDIRRYLRGEAILARPASAFYQVRKFARRNKGLVTAVSGIFAAILVGTVVSILFALRADDNARLANERERTAIYQSYRAGSRPRSPHWRNTTSSMPPASWKQPRSRCASGNGDTCTPGSTIARRC